MERPRTYAKLSKAALVILALVSCRERQERTPEQVAQAFLRSFARGDAMELGKLVDPALPRIDKRRHSCKKEKLEALACELEQMEIPEQKASVLRSNDGLTTPAACDRAALSAAARACVCRTQTERVDFALSTTHSILKRVGLSSKTCRLLGITTLTDAELRSELREWGEACSDFRPELPHALARIGCEGQSKPIALVLRNEGGWKVFSLSASTREAYE